MTKYPTPLDGGLFQSPDWSDFQKYSGKTVWSIDGVSGIEQLLSFGLGHYRYAPRFPGKSITKELLDKVLRDAQASRAVFIRIEPQTEELLHAINTSTTNAIHKSPSDVQPREILMLDLTKSEDQLLAQMKQKTRYNIRLAAKHDVTVTATRDQGEQDTFLNLLSQTAARKEIHFHSREYYQKFVEFFSEEQCELMVAKKDNEVLAGLLIFYYQDTAYYLHGGSSDQGRQYMAPYLLQWEAMKRAKECGMTYYDLGGVAIQEPAPTGKDWSGITRFKQGFAPKEKSTLFPGAYDIVINRWRYSLYRLLRSLKGIFS